MSSFLSNLNPELRRNLWLEFSSHRLIVMPLILLIIFYITYSGYFHNIDSVQEMVINLILFLLVIWGTGLSADAIFEEIQDKTWESQRMTPLGAWSMTWGKLFGKTAFVWYGTLLCVLIYFIAQNFTPPKPVTENLFHGFPKQYFDISYVILIGIAAQAFAFFSAILIQRISPIRSRSRVTLIQIFTIFVFLSWYAFGKVALDKIYGDHSWYNLNIPYPIFIFCTQLFIIFWLLVGIYRLLRTELQVPTYTWVWPIFVICWSVYFLGFVSLSNSNRMFGQEIPSLVINAWYWGVSYYIILSLTFLSALFTPKNIVATYRWADLIKEQKYSKALTIMPAWLSSGVLAFVVLIPFIYYVSKGFQIENDKFISQLIGMAISMILFLIRDIGILYFVCWNPKVKSGHLATIVYLVLLYIFIPIALSALGMSSYWLTALTPSAWLLQPTTNLSQVISLNLIIVLEVLVVMSGVVYRWRQNRITGG